MRVISGVAGRRNIRVPESVARPSTDKLREALFSILGNRVEGARVLDLFAGSGALGLECLSRGAASCVFIDNSRESAKVIQKNIEDLRLLGGRFVRSDVFKMLTADRGKYDLVFADPPYFKKLDDIDFVHNLLENANLPNLLADNALLVVEQPATNHAQEMAQWQLLDQRKYGGCGILFYQLATTV